MEDIYVYDAGQKAPIEGLEEIRSAIRANINYHVQLMQYERGEILELPDKPTTSDTDLRKKYPRADAYYTALVWSKSGHTKKAALGDQAMKRILDGEDYAVVLDEMQNAWNAFLVAQEE